MINLDNLCEIWKKDISSSEKFGEALHEIFLEIEKKMLYDLYQEHRKNIDKNIKKVGVNIGKTR